MYLFRTKNFDKSLSELQHEQKDKENELKVILQRYRDKHGVNLQGVKLESTFDPNSDLGKLVLGGKASLHKDCLDPVSQILVAQSVYLRVEMKELIKMKSTQHVLEKRKTIDEAGVSGWIQQKRKKIPQLTHPLESTTRSSADTDTEHTPAAVVSEQHDSSHFTTPFVDTSVIVKREETSISLEDVCAASSALTQQQLPPAEVSQTALQDLEKMTLGEILASQWEGQEEAEALCRKYRHRLPHLDAEMPTYSCDSADLDESVLQERVPQSHAPAAATAAETPELCRVLDAFCLLRSLCRDWRCLVDATVPQPRDVRPTALTGSRTLDQILEQQERALAPAAAAAVSVELCEEIFYPDLLRAAML